MVLSGSPISFDLLLKKNPWLMYMSLSGPPMNSVLYVALKSSLTDGNRTQ